MRKAFCEHRPMELSGVSESSVAFSEGQGFVEIDDDDCNGTQVTIIREGDGDQRSVV